MSIPPRFLDELRARVTLSDVIGKRVRLTRNGREFKGCCPFHNEKTPSFYVNDDKQFFHCFGCGAHGSVIDFVMRHDNQSFPEAVETIAGMVGMQVPKSAPEDVEKAKKEKSLYTMLEDAAKWMEDQLRNPANKVPYQYICERGVADETLRAFRVGYAPSDMQSLRKHLSLKGYTDAQMVEGGLLKMSDKGKDPYAFFRERVMFPVPDRRGRIVAFGGRVLPEHLREPSRGDFTPPKYINSSDTPLFHKGKMLYGEPHARQAASEGQPILVVEGYLDVIACWMNGYKGAVAPLGTALTEDQILVLWKMIPDDVKIPVLCFDGDNAGRRAASRACERLIPLIKPNHSAKIAFLPEGEDPDSLMKAKGREAFQAVLDNAMNLVDFYFFDETEGKVFETPELRAGLSARLEEIAARIQDRTLQHYYREAFREKMRKMTAPKGEVAPQRQAWQPRPNNGYNNRPRFGQPAPVMPVVPLKKPTTTRADMYHEALLACVINNPSVFAAVEDDFSCLHLSEPRMDALRQAATSYLSHHYDGVDADAVQTHLREVGFVGELGALLSDRIYTHASFARRSMDEDADVVSLWRSAWKIVQEQGIKADIEDAILALKNDPSPENEERLHELRKIMKRNDA